MTPREPADTPRQLVGTQLDSVDGLAQLRRSVQAALRSERVPDHLDDLVLGIHEVAVNALVHGTPPVTVALWASTGELVCEVSAAGSGPADPTGPDTMPAPDRTSGRGAALRSLAWHATHRRSARGTTVVLRATR